MPAYTEHPTLTCPCFQDEGVVCGRPTFLVDGRPYHETHCFECLMIGSYSAGLVVSMGRALGEDAREVEDSTPDAVRRFLVRHRARRALAALGL